MKSRFEYTVARGLLAPAKTGLVYTPALDGGELLKEWAAKPLHEFLNHMGSEGWRVKEMFSTGAGQGWCVVFEREIG